MYAGARTHGGAQYMKRITFADVPADVLNAVGGEFRTFGWRGEIIDVVDIWRDPRTGIAITVVVDGPTGRTWLANPGCDASRPASGRETSTSRDPRR